MHDRVKYEYAVIRIVPKVEREEFFNVGAILYCQRKKFLGVKFQICKDKLTNFSCEIDFETLTDYLKAWEDICIGAPKGGAIGKLELSDRFRWLTASRSTIIQSSETHSGLCLDPEKELGDLYESFVL
ncbi:DUF3037 domain-containing protein [Arenibacter sp. F20364]|uniref:DUF3037 domain-containing protein n=1 Tax=Arenibacter sp. F20364 TaxID=2926415 RepID=UPI001FF4A7BC|nr:DUF3037 domain-containing protein [Arenibacter sp. F20364]MCK0192583.1 DUF3037 domain-containing protein [Arenibacter sp. F20364]